MCNQFLKTKGREKSCKTASYGKKIEERDGVWMFNWSAHTKHTLLPTVTTQQGKTKARKALIDEDKGA